MGYTATSVKFSEVKEDNGPDSCPAPGHTRVLNVRELRTMDRRCPTPETIPD